MTSLPHLSCDAARLALSAQLDDEDPGTPAAHVAAHLDGCAGCRQWLAAAEQVNRVVPLDPGPAPDLTARIMAAVAAAPTGADDTRAPALSPAARTARWRNRLQVATVAIAAAQLVVALPELLGALGFGDTPHASHEVASLDAALAVGFLVAGMRPALARAYTPVGFVLAVCLIVTSGFDLLQGLTTLTHVTTHVVVVVQAALVWALSRTVPPVDGPAARSAPVGT
jgi:predicted anti-sigma-YlaC factor YlaD